MRPYGQIVQSQAERSEESAVLAIRHIKATRLAHCVPLNSYDINTFWMDVSAQLTAVSLLCRFPTSAYILRFGNS